MESFDPFRLIDVLSKHDVPFVIIGGHAVAHHGYVRATEDTDIVFRRTTASEIALSEALAELNACWIGDTIDPKTGVEEIHLVSLPFVRANRLMMLVTDFGFLDVFDYIPGLPQAPVEQLFETAIGSDGRKYASLSWLRAMKTAANRPQDQLDLENLPPEC